MILPENGSVVIIDDQPQEAIPLIQALSKRGISVTYYKGYNKEDLPAKNLQSVRLVILDLQLFAGVNDSRTIATNLVTILQQILGDNNGPYILLLWSKKESIHSPDFIKEVKKPENKVVPIVILSLPKNECLITQSSDSEGVVEDVMAELEDNFSEETDVDTIRKKIIDVLRLHQESSYVAKPNAIEIIEKAIDVELRKAGVFHLFVIWENLIKKSGSKIVSDIFKLVQFNEKWELNARDIIRRMGVARVGVNVVDNDVLIKESINTLNNSFIDSLELELKSTSIPEYIDIKGETLIAVTRDNVLFTLVKEADGEYSLYKDQSRLSKNKKMDGLQKSVQTNAKILEADKNSSAQVISIYNKIPNILNTKLHIELSPSQELIPGNIYMKDNIDAAKKDQYLQTYFSKIGDPTKYSLIELEVSPICDYAQSKWKRSRVLPGVMFHSELAEGLRQSPTYFYDVQPIFEIGGDLFQMRFDYRLFHALDKTHHNDRAVKYRLKREILLDIIAQLSSHVHRPGISFVS